MTLKAEDVKGRLAFLEEAEKLKSVLRNSRTSTGRPESAAEHSWRLCLMAIVFEKELAGLDMLKLLKICVLHDLGEAIHGDIPAVEQSGRPDKSAQEKADLTHLARSLDEEQRAGVLALWQDYEDAASPEARAAKALDKMETILQHNQGINPPDFDYEFNLTYGRKHTDADPFFALLRGLLDQDTSRRARERLTAPPLPPS